MNPPPSYLKPVISISSKSTSTLVHDPPPNCFNILLNQPSTLFLIELSHHFLQCVCVCVCAACIYLRECPHPLSSEEQIYGYHISTITEHSFQRIITCHLLNKYNKTIIIYISNYFKL